MRLATGISALFIAVLVGIYSYGIYNAGVLAESSSHMITGGLGAVVMFLLIFGGALSFREPRRAETLFIIGLVTSLLAGVFLNWIMLIFAALSFVLYRMSLKAGKEAQDRPVVS